LRGLRAWVGFRQTGVDYLRPERPFGRSTHGWLKNLWWARKGIFSFTSLPVEWLGYVGGVMTVLSLVAVLYELVDWLRHPAISRGVGTLIVVIVLFGSLNLLALAVLGEYLIKIVEEAKRRPRFIRRAVRQGDQHLTKAEDIERFAARRRAAVER
jgi:dolichol-phosphate mannosyltransferase